MSTEPASAYATDSAEASPDANASLSAACRRFCVWLGCMLGLLGAAQAFAKDTLLWYRTDFPPAFIESGPQSQTGFGDRIQRLMIDSLPEFAHRTVLANFNRIAHDLKSLPNACAVALVKTPEREVDLVFSELLGIALPSRLIVQRGSLPLVHGFLTEQGQVRLAPLLASGKFTLGVAKSRRYGKSVDEVITARQGTPAVFERIGIDQFAGLLAMMVSGQRGINGIVGYPEELQYFSQQLGIASEQFVQLPIEGSPAYIAGYVGCSKSALGQKAIAHINRVIAKHRAGLLRQYYEDWLDTATRAQYDQLVRGSAFNTR